MDTDGRKVLGGRFGMNWVIGIDIYTPMCIKWMTNKNLLYKKINKIQKQNTVVYDSRETTSYVYIPFFEGLNPYTFFFFFFLL